MKAHEGSSAGTRGEALRAREDVVISRLTALAPALDGEPDPAFRAAARARLVAMAAVRTPGTPVVATRRTVLGGWRRRLTAGLATVAVVAAALTALVAFAAGSGPGDPLYGVKRGTEQTELALAADSRRGPLLLHQAGTRLAEVHALAAEPRTNAALVVQTLRTMDAQTADAATWFDARAIHSRSAAPVDQLSRWAAGQSRSLETLRAELPAAVSTAVQHSLDLLAATQSRADAVRGTVTTAGRTPATGTSGAPGGSRTGPHSPGAPTSVVGGPATGAGTDTPVPNSGPSLAPNPGRVPTLPSPGAPSGLGGLPTLPVPHASAPSATLPLPTLPLPTLPVPSGTAVCDGPLSVGGC